MDDIKQGDRVKFREDLHTNALLLGELGTVTAVYDLPGQGGRTVDILLDSSNEVEHGIRVSRLESA